jgi:hypothetical protein
MKEKTNQPTKKKTKKKNPAFKKISRKLKPQQ